MGLHRWLWVGFAATVLQACTSTVYYRQQLPAAHTEVSPRKLMVFLDGTHNDAASDTNIKRLHALVALQNRPALATLYVEGVGTGADLVLGAGTGVGFESRVVLAYNFLRNNFRAGDQIYIFGFSRGAFEARTLAALLEHVGLPDAPDLSEPLFEKQVQHSRRLYEEMKRGFHDKRFPCEIAQARHQQGYRSRMVEVLGLWDTVGALGGGITQWPAKLLDKASILPVYVDIDEPNKRYGDQLRNVRHVLHAVSLDDDREWIFTPLLLSRQHLDSPKLLPKASDVPARLFHDCPAGTPEDVNPKAQDSQRAQWDSARRQLHEVWFAGAHSDVGGGYPDSDLAGVSLNWMIQNLRAIDDTLLPASAQVREDIYGSSHDPETGVFKPLYHRANRNLAAYALGDAQSCALGTSARACGSTGLHEPMTAHLGKLCMHPSVFWRRQAMPPLAHENHALTLLGAGTVYVKALPELPPANPPRLQEVDKGTPGSTALQILQWDAQTRQCLEAP